MGSELNRRDLVKRAMAVGLVAVPSASFLTACASDSGDKTDKPKETGTVSAKNPLGVKEGAPLEAFIFKGGFGDDYVKNAETAYNTTYKTTVKHTGTQALGPKLQPRFAGGSPPDVMDNSGADNLDTAALAKQGKLVDLTPLLDAASFDDPAKKVRDTLIAGTIEQGQYGGKEVYALNYAFTVYGTWYSNKLFKEKGWTYPQTLTEQLALFEKIKAAGIAPYTYPGKYPYYVHFDIFAQIAKAGGVEGINAIDNLEPKAFQTDAVKGVIAYYEELAAKGYILQGSEGKTHIQAQTDWTKGKAAFIPNGSWVENEAAPTMSKDFDLAVGPIQGAASDKLPYGAIRAAAGEPFIVAKDGKNPAGGMELLRIMLSKAQAKAFTESLKSLTAVAGAEEGLTLTPGLASASAGLKAAAANVVNPRLGDWYKKLNEETIGNLTLDLLSGKIKAAEWITKAQAASDATAKDSAIPKFKHA
ncbi:N-acetylglucosamine/diacetylchitobiose ABC transporter substrate-binding protein [Streptomyces sp. RKAG337]|uniref:N-acetylglucosamine/diacetylchitobiose ABC transporter substrate-binding protein n=1 Tax=Streptomyces sp. RKAG337 TaxID=2893404 RepID=UPI0020340116|nr:N-acetylglucosamine/diacetylchitobiose ABC transporter substrate-binding protein [Streptomyces sp. RKAG337]MCM2425614.1 N-acetylglucosamine/diacetylchitobiose ABC transporter substrate-binding protein [Streptomyces sp. RKAG337]